MTSPESQPATASLELPVAEVLRRARGQRPYGLDIIEDLAPAEAAAFLDAVLR